MRTKRFVSQNTYFNAKNVCRVIKHNLKQFVHLSALGIEEAKESKYAASKLHGENEIKKIFNNYVILKPSLVYSVDDKFSTMLMTMLKFLPFFQFTTTERQYFIQFLLLIFQKLQKKRFQMK